MRLKKLLESRGIDAATLNHCRGLHALKLLGIKQGVLRGDEDVENLSAQAVEPAAQPVAKPVSPPSAAQSVAPQSSSEPPRMPKNSFAV